MHSQQRRDSHQQPPPRPVAHGEECSHVPLHAASGRVLCAQALRSPASEEPARASLQANENARERSVATRVQPAHDAAAEHNLEQLERHVRQVY